MHVTLLNTFLTMFLPRFEEAFFSLIDTPFLSIQFIVKNYDGNSTQFIAFAM